MRAGRVTVNGEVALEMGIRVVAGADEVRLDGVIVAPAIRRWIAYHKPPGVTTTRSDPHADRTIYDELPEELGGLRYVGRLDRDAEGLLLLTNDGGTANLLQRPRQGVEREYRLSVAGVMGPASLQSLRSGVQLDDGPAVPKWVGGVDRHARTTELTLVLTEGRKREVRRMMSAVGHPVMRLRRVRFGPIELGDLEPGSWRELDGGEVARLVGATG